ncbi:NAD(P)-dependent oxidoreductase [Streptomyces sp. WP-1]|uniref:NAD-dependent epimerase/dehydratase family protein n=1 Tax=Streptomyces sp. WP-1 TaxID=3041497 RepID=UPI002647EB91|nr:NAD(P)-dependent oxidoreductase [Streptomyces sp. WP-1]WKE67838.1 NAD(P)-dependent oxidoreductase [Streptomyces sp. WP-1]
MILVTGGAGFIGSHTVRALHAAGEKCVLLQRRTPALPPQLHDVPAAMAQGDIADLESLREVGRRHTIAGIVHLAITPPWAAGGEDAVGAVGRALDGFLNIVRVAEEWGVRRVVVASTIGVYGGVAAEGALGEDLPLPMGYFHAIPTLKKVTELLAGQLAAESGIEIVAARISGTWGPGGHLPDPFFPAPSLAHAAARRTVPDLSGLAHQPYAEDSLDLCYVKDTGRALALLQRTPVLRHTTYNVGSGRATSNAEVIAAIAATEPGFHTELPSRDTTAPRQWLDTTRLREDTGFTPEYDTAAAAADYIGWLRAGNER